MFRILDEGTGEELASFREGDFKAGPNGALYAAARFATRRAKEAGQAVLLEGPDLRRRYAPEYASKHGNRPYRVPCAVPGCPNWVHPVNPKQQPTCREHYAGSPDLVDQAARMREARAARRPKP